MNDYVKIKNMSFIELFKFHGKNGDKKCTNF